VQKEMPIRDVNQRFTECVREVQESGDEIIITRRGQPVAKLVPIASAKRVLTPTQQAGLARMMAWLDDPKPLGIADKFDRDALYDRDEEV
jgi:prevent-host-death family protein